MCERGSKVRDGSAAAASKKGKKEEGRQSLR